MKAAELAWAAIDHIEANPETYDGIVWIARHGNLITADFAGRVCLINGDQPDFDSGTEHETPWVTTTDGDLVSVPWRAKTLLGIDPYDECAELPGTAAEVEKLFGPRPAPVTEVERVARHAAPEEPAAEDAKPRRGWRVVRQKRADVARAVQTLVPEVDVCRHRWEWTAELHAHWLGTWHSRHEVGVTYTVYPAVKP